eukprot:jgi/Galph1/735/GphlegSOOS_G5571.1
MRRTTSPLIHDPRQPTWKRRKFRGLWFPENAERRKRRIERDFGTLPSPAPLNSYTMYGGATEAFLLSSFLSFLVLRLTDIKVGKAYDQLKLIQLLDLYRICLVCK